MTTVDIIHLIIQIEAEEAALKVLQPGESEPLPPIKIGSGSKRRIYHITVERPA